MHAALPHAIHAATRGQRVILCTRNPVIARDWIEHARNLRSIRIVYSAGMQAIHFQHGGACRGPAELSGFFSGSSCRRRRSRDAGR